MQVPNIGLIISWSVQSGRQRNGQMCAYMDEWTDGSA